MQGRKVITPCAVAIGALLAISAGGRLLTQDAEKKRDILKDIDPGDGWIYDDYTTALAKAKKESKPLFVVFR